MDEMLATIHRYVGIISELRSEKSALEREVDHLRRCLETKRHRLTRRGY